MAALNLMIIKMKIGIGENDNYGDRHNYLFFINNMISWIRVIRFTLLIKELNLRAVT